MDEDTLLQELVAQYLVHDGYVETARAFTQEVRDQYAPVESGEALSKKYDLGEDTEAVNRQSK